jgi:tRNA modification GTPase
MKIISELLESYEDGRVLREGISVLIVGKPNAGKSSLLNRLLNENRAIVTHMPGTTRDIIEETVTIEGLSIRFLDTAGIRHTDDLVEQKGISRALEKIPLADLVLAVFDSSKEFSQEDQLILDCLAECRSIAVFNKVDLPRIFSLQDEDQFACSVNISTISGEGIELLKHNVRTQFLKSTHNDPREFVALSKARHRDALLSAEQLLQKFASALPKGNLELLALDLRGALESVGAVTGQTSTDEVLDQIFSSFCIGK